MIVHLMNLKIHFLMLYKHILIKWDKISSDGINHRFKSLDSHIIWMDVKIYSKKLCSN